MAIPFRNPLAAFHHCSILEIIKEHLVLVGAVSVLASENLNLVFGVARFAFKDLLIVWFSAS